MIKILENWPPNIDQIREHLTLTGEEVFTYGSTIFNPSGKSLTPDLINHESVHIKQQGKEPEKWWTLYLDDPLFRGAMEIPGSQVQYFTAKKYIKDRNRLHAYLVQLAKNLSSPTYGGIMTFQEAINAIKDEQLFDVSRLANNKK